MSGTISLKTLENGDSKYGPYQIAFSSVYIFLRYIVVDMVEFKSTDMARFEVKGTLLME